MTASTPRVLFDPYDYDFHEDPYPTYAALRENAPLYRNDALEFWALSRHADVLDAFRDPERFSSADGVSLDPAATGPQAERVMSFLAMDAPRHLRLRSTVMKGFTPRRVKELEGRVREITREHLRTALENDGFDFIGDLAGKLPMDVISELVGVPSPDRGELRRLADLVVHREEGVLDVPPAAIEASLQLVTYYLDLIGMRRRQREEDLISALIDVEVDGARLTDDELCAFLFLMVAAGNETTTKLLGNAWYWGDRHPAQRGGLLDGSLTATQWVEETLRYDASSQIIARTATEDVPLHGGVIPAGGRVLLLIGSANRDERVFDRAAEYDLTRDTTGLLSFGGGPHFCMGAALARLESRIVLEELLGLISGYEVDTDRCGRVHSVNVRGFSHLPTVVQRR